MNATPEQWGIGIGIGLFFAAPFFYCSIPILFGILCIAAYYNIVIPLIAKGIVSFFGLDR
jgi:cytochrome c biogenesis protein CcdA